MKYKILTTSTFDRWLAKQKDRQAVRAIAMRIARAEQGSFGDSESVGEGVSEMRIFVGKGYRIYYTVHGEYVVLLLNGGNKSNKKQQQEDIAKAKQIMQDFGDYTWQKS
ncbi:type II toxin-antitoxin system RelE/ParE family toxin [Thiomicrospira microaerophila]|uniref:type II toxin-antitoxin system RelE/ParE family toxin n=1 Tax=Thiomicrospira microaerophila TaxID=406020 RepID=UPI0005CA23CF|nr:type II toxin-antitoxin system RelE/ParE family toxin [Thiomicrospira microaerophila]